MYACAAIFVIADPSHDPIMVHGRLRPGKPRSLGEPGAKHDTSVNGLIVCHHADQAA